jgi:hypothetical protein
MTEVAPPPVRPIVAAAFRLIVMAGLVPATYASMVGALMTGTRPPLTTSARVLPA